jgi:hypothetical protein
MRNQLLQIKSKPPTIQRRRIHLTCCQSLMTKSAFLSSSFKIERSITCARQSTHRTCIPTCFLFRARHIFRRFCYKVALEHPYPVLLSLSRKG